MATIKCKIFDLDKENGICKLEVENVNGDRFLYENATVKQYPPCIELEVENTAIYVPKDELYV